ncbi:hypothetical protein DCS_06505 [Drechmeria coniospora]|uniref:tRNA-splicing endonuclease subunit Sen34 n=1 Tax=Drechmeria coniospora TaxID=98403 RepID=A0A151GBX0_DRECN|nr:hypothetical protein DCS_06505 [Drechmeria coniospora]KYK54545.1 hypothetical protein DCS_06505 [Drechmeria coniospora]ODA81435.1 hypothetical protein RJ55_04402 [Drechmeria coniospora]
MSDLETTWPDVVSPVRISKIADRFLVFDPDAAAVLRRVNNVNGTLFGTTPQQPTQNTFLGLPLELRPEEANSLVRRRAAYIVDDVAAHGSVLLSSSHDVRKTFAESLRRYKRVAEQALAENSAKKAADMAVQLRLSRPSHGVSVNAVCNEQRQPHSLEESCPHSQVGNEAKFWGITPACSGELVPQNVDSRFCVAHAVNGPLCHFLQDAGYYMTPGLRFGAHYSVYPGDPLRFHAHFMANQYGWDEEIPILDVVCGGRLAAAVKKAFLLGGEPVPSEGSHPAVRTFSVEWAAM